MGGKESNGNSQSKNVIVSFSSNIWRVESPHCPPYNKKNVEQIENQQPL